MGNSVECFAKVQVNNIHCSPCVDRRGYFVVDGDQLPWHDLPLGNLFWLLSITCFIWFITSGCFVSKLKALRLHNFNG